jgi:hypothetical protein
MLFQLGDIRILLAGNDERIEQYWRELTGPTQFSAETTTTPHITFQLELCDTLPPLPTSQPDYSDAIATDGQAHILDTYTIGDSHTILHFIDGAIVNVPATITAGQTPHIQGWMTPNIFTSGRFIDVVLVSLAPLLRKRGYFLLHAAAVALDQQAILFVGPSGSGKTTTCLTLIDAGWQLLSNDIVLLKRDNSQILALPVPDQISLRPKTRELLPYLQTLPNGDNSTLQLGTIATRHVVGDQWGVATPVFALCFPHVTDNDRSVIEPQSRSIALAWLLEESIDSWDGATLPAHASILADLAAVTRSYRLHLAPDIAKLPALLASLLPATIVSAQ